MMRAFLAHAPTGSRRPDGSPLLVPGAPLERNRLIGNHASMKSDLPKSSRPLAGTILSIGLALLLLRLATPRVAVADVQTQDHFVRVVIRRDGRTQTAYMRHFDPDSYASAKFFFNPHLEDSNPAAGLEVDSSRTTVLDSLVAICPEGFRCPPGTMMVADSPEVVTSGKDTILHFVQGRLVRRSELQSVLVDSLLWADEYYQEAWVDAKTAKTFRTRKPTFYDKMFAECGAYAWILAVGFDPKWDRTRYRQLLDRKSFGGGCDFKLLNANPMDSLHLFHPEIRKAVREGKIFLFHRWSP